MLDDTPDVTEEAQDRDEETPDPAVTYEQVSAGAPDGTEMLGTPPPDEPPLDVEPGRVDMIHRPDPPAEDAVEAEADSVKPPDVVDADEFDKRLDEAATKEGRLSLAKPYPIRCIPRPFEVMIAPPREQSFYEKVFELGSQDEPSDDEVDRGFVKALVLACVVEPVLTEAMLDKLIEVNEHQFSALANRCLKTVYDDVGGTLERIGQLDTGAQERVFVNVRGSTNTPTPV